MTLIQELTITDDVTGLFNARHLYTLLDEQVAQGQPFSLMFVDLDHFKSVNDTHGHLIGSRLLAEIGGPAQTKLGGRTTPPFAMVATNLSLCSPVWANRLPAEPRWLCATTSVRARFLEGAGLSLTVSGSFGLATYPEDGNTVPTILRAADTMMYEAKVTRDNVAVAGKGLIDRIPTMASPPWQWGRGRLSPNIQADGPSRDSR